MHFRINILKFKLSNLWLLMGMLQCSFVAQQNLIRGIMKQTVGIILSVAGLIGVIFFGIQYLNDSESFELLGADVAVSTGDYIPILISLVVLIVGVVIYRMK